MNENTLHGTLLDENTVLSLQEFCHACSRQEEWVVELVEEGVLEPIENKQPQWQFSGASLQRAHITLRLQRDLGINIAGIALALELLEEVESLRAQLNQLDTAGNI